MQNFNTYIKTAKGQTKYARNALHAFGMGNPFTFGTITLVIGFIAGALIF
jgi:hypothetical protein